MKSKKIKSFDSVAFFRSIKEKLATEMEGMTLAEKKEFMKQIREGKTKIPSLTDANKTNLVV